ncbi:MAG: tyrosine-type recombinase/integrase, partial [Deltaproteobacteria bacterium]|nr:tyrosine-type recombinase/integrase [Deltaproteobacteria bacterium]
MKNLVHFDALLFGLYSGMRRGEATALRWEDVDMGRGFFQVEETKTGQPLELPVTRQLEEILARRMAGREDEAEELGRWVFPSPGSESGHVEELHRH